MSCWQILHIEPTNDTRAIRRAYAKLLKTTRPDDDAAAYQTLREAFDEALAIAPYLATDDEDDDWSFDNETDATGRADGQPFSDGPDDADDTAMPSENADRIIRHIQNIHHQAGGRGLLKLWPPIARRIAALDEYERGEVLGYLAGWLQQPGGLPKKLQKRWQKDYGLPAGQEYQERPSENQEDDFFAGLFIVEAEPEAGVDAQESVRALFSQIDRWYDNGGIRPVLDHADEIEAAFAEFSLEDTGYLAYHCLQWLRRRQIRNPHLWLSWAEYFGWGDYNRAFLAGNRLSEEELENLAAYRQDSPQTPAPPPHGRESEAELSAQLAAQLENWFAEGGDKKLTECWPQTRGLFNRFPLGSADRLSRQCAAFLHDRVTAPLVWQRWAKYFGWTADSFPDLFSPEETRLLAANADAETVPADPSASLFALLDKLAAEGGSAALLQQRTRIETLLHEIPPEAIDAVSDGLATFLRERGLDSPQLWLLFADSFNWFAPFYRHLLDAGEAAGLEHWRRLEAQDFPAAALLSPSWPEAVSVHAADLIRRICRTYWQEGSGGLLAAWPQFSDEIENADYEDYDTVTAFLSCWPHPQRLSRRLLLLWQEHYGTPIPDADLPRRFAETEEDGAYPDENPVYRENAFSDGLEADHIFAFLQECNDKGGGNALVQAWPHIRAMLDDLPLGGADEVSPHFAAFLRRRRITHPLLWTQWADYFRWHEDFRNQILSPTESERLATYRRTAALLAGIGITGTDDPSDTSARETLSDGLGNPPRIMPYTRAFARFLGRSPGFWRSLAAACAVMAVWPEVSRETDPAERDETAAFHPSLYRLFEWGGEWRGAWLIIILSACITAGIWFSPSGGGQSLPWGVLVGLLTGAVVIALSIVGYGLLLSMPDHIPWLANWLQTKWPRIKYHPKAAPLFLITLPALPSVVAHIMPDGEYNGLITFCCFAASAFYYFPHCFGDRQTDDSTWNWNWTAALLSLAPAVEWIAQALPENIRLDALAAVLLWFNANLFLFFDRRERFDRIADFIGRAARFQTASLPLRPFAAIAAGVSWLLLIPAYTLRAAMRGQYGLILETAVIAAVLMIPLPETLHPHGLLLFYPALMLAAWLHLLLTRTALRLLERFPAA